MMCDSICNDNVSVDFENLPKNFSEHYSVVQNEC